MLLMWLQMRLRPHGCKCCLSIQSWTPVKHLPHNCFRKYSWDGATTCLVLNTLGSGWKNHICLTPLKILLAEDWQWCPTFLKKMLYVLLITYNLWLPQVHPLLHLALADLILASLWFAGACTWLNNKVYDCFYLDVVAEVIISDNYLLANLPSRNTLLVYRYIPVN